MAGWKHDHWLWSLADCLSASDRSEVEYREDPLLLVLNALSFVKFCEARSWLRGKAEQASMSR